MVRTRSSWMTTRFRLSVFRGRCRTNLIAGLVLLTLAGAYGVFAGGRFARRGADQTAFDQPLVRAAARLNRPPVHLASLPPTTNNELYLTTVISDQRDVLFGLTVLLLRTIVTLTIGGLGLVLLTAGATEWEIRSEFARAAAEGRPA